MSYATNLGFPRIGGKRELKRALEAYWAGKSSRQELLDKAGEVRRERWQLQAEAGLDQIPAGDFSLYDHVLDTAAMVGAVPDRFGRGSGEVDLETYFAMARGRTGDNGAAAMEMTKWFDTNYHYIVPELERGQSFRLASTKIIDEYTEARELGYNARPVLLGPVSFLLLGKSRSEDFDALKLLDGLLEVYVEVLARLAEAGSEWVQLDEPTLILNLHEGAGEAFRKAYGRLGEASGDLKLLLATYFGDLRENLKLATSLPVDALHLDLLRGADQLEHALQAVPGDMWLSLGLIDGRNIWRADLAGALETARRAADVLGPERLMVAPSCSLLHCPVDLDYETDLDPEIRGWLAFAKQKAGEIAAISRGLNEGADAIAAALDASATASKGRQTSRRIHDPKVQDRMGSITEEMSERDNSYRKRREAQKDALDLPLLPTTTIGSFPQTTELRKKRAAFRKGELGPKEYDGFLREEIARTVAFQEEAGLDVLVHGEPERTDMVEYFGTRMEGFVSTANGWVQSYGSRCVKPPILFGDVSRLEPMTVEWSRYAQSLTDRPMKGMLTGPITILQWSFVRDDQPRRDTAWQIALAVRDEVQDLEAAGVGVIQIDEPALREGLPLRREDWEAYLAWSVKAFRLATCGVADTTQIHTHMCYAEFGDILESIAALDADVISIESSRSDMELLEIFAEHAYPNEIGPGVWDIHSPRVPSVEEMRRLLTKAAEVLRAEQLWVNPDCGLKTRKWDEVKPALQNMVAAAKKARAELGQTTA